MNFIYGWLLKSCLELCNILEDNVNWWKIDKLFLELTSDHISANNKYTDAISLSKSIVLILYALRDFGQFWKVCSIRDYGTVTD